MEISDVKRAVRDTIDRARRAAAERRARSDRAAQEYDAFLERAAVPIVRQIANVLKAERQAFTVFTPGGAVRLMSDRSAEDFVELFLDTNGEEPLVALRTSRARGRRVLATEQVVGTGRPEDLGEEEVLSAVLKALEPFLER